MKVADMIASAVFIGTGYLKLVLGCAPTLFVSFIFAVKCTLWLQNSRDNQVGSVVDILCYLYGIIRSPIRRICCRLLGLYRDRTQRDSISIVATILLKIGIFKIFISTQSKRRYFFSKIVFWTFDCLFQKKVQLVLLFFVSLYQEYKDGPQLWLFKASLSLVPYTTSGSAKVVQFPFDVLSCLFSSLIFSQQPNVTLRYPCDLQWISLQQR